MPLGFSSTANEESLSEKQSLLESTRVKNGLSDAKSVKRPSGRYYEPFMGSRDEDNSGSKDDDSIGSTDEKGHTTGKTFYSTDEKSIARFSKKALYSIDKSDTVILPVSSELAILLASSDADFADVVFSILGPIDKLATTILWYPNVMAKILDPKMAGLGAVLDFMTQSDPASQAVRYIFYTTCFLAAAGNAFLQVLDQDEADKQKLQHLQDLKEILVAGTDSNLTPQQRKEFFLKNLSDFGKFYLQKVIENNPEMAAKYESMEFIYLEEADEANLPFDPSKLRIKYKVKKPAQPKVEVASKPATKVLAGKKYTQLETDDPESDDDNDVQEFKKSDKVERLIEVEILKEQTVSDIADTAQNTKHDKDSAPAPQSKWSRTGNYLVNTVWKVWIEEYFWAKFVKQKVWESFIKPVWASGAITTFVFWTMFILTVATTGTLLDHGIFGLSVAETFAIPASIGSAFLLLQVGSWAYNRYKYGPSPNDSILEARVAADQSKLITEAYQRKKYEADFRYILKKEVLLLKEMDEMEEKRWEKFSEEDKAEIRDFYRRANATPKKSPGLKALDAWYEQPVVRALAAGATGFVGNYGLTQYWAWYAKDLWVLGKLQDFLQVALFVTLAISGFDTIIGGVMMGIGGAFALGAMVHRYSEAKKLKDDIKGDAESAEALKQTLKEMNDTLDKRKEYLLALKTELQKRSQADDKFWKELEEKRQALGISSDKLEISPAGTLNQRVIVPSTLLPPKPEIFSPIWVIAFWQRLYKNSIHYAQLFKNSTMVEAWDWVMTGLFFSRLFFTLAAVFLPFAALAAVASNPVTFGIVIGIAVIHVGLKWYEKRQALKDKKLQEVPKELEQVEKDIALAEKYLNVFEMNQMLRKYPKGENSKSTQQNVVFGSALQPSKSVSVESTAVKLPSMVDSLSNPRSLPTGFSASGTSLSTGSLLSNTSSLFGGSLASGTAAGLVSGTVVNPSNSGVPTVQPENTQNQGSNANPIVSPTTDFGSTLFMQGEMDTASTPLLSTTPSLSSTSSSSGLFSSSSTVSSSVTSSSSMQSAPKTTGAGASLHRPSVINTSSLKLPHSKSLDILFGSSDRYSAHTPRTAQIRGINLGSFD